MDLFASFSGLRLFALVLGAALLGAVYLNLRKHRSGRGATWMAALAGLGAIALALFPGLANIPSDALSLRDEPMGRVVTLLVFAVAVLMLIALWNRQKLARLAVRHDQLVRAQGLNAILDQDAVRAAAGSRDIWAVIPVFNEQENLVKLLPEMPDTISGRRVGVLVVNDGSTDGSAETARELGALVLDMPLNAGGGTGLRAGFDAVKRLGGDYIVTLDGDGQHLPSEMPAMVDPLLQGEADLVVGSRLLGAHEHTSMVRSVGVHVFNALITALIASRVTDCASGYRAFTTASLRQMYLVQEQYHTAELIIEAAKCGCRITERPITIRRRHSGVSKKGGNVLYGAFFLRTILKTWLR